MQIKQQFVRNFLRTGTAVSLLVPGLVSATDDRPNVMVVLADDLGWGYIGAGFESYNTTNLNSALVSRDITSGKYTLQTALMLSSNSVPTIRRLISEGVRFSDAHVANSLCGPSRAAILTGRYPATMGIYNNQDLKQSGVPADVTMLPKLFQQNGYTTGAFGKWHLADVGSANGDSPAGQHPLDKGFDYYFGFNLSETEYYNSGKLWTNHTHCSASTNYLTDQITANADAFIRGATNKPFFAYVAFNAVHGPLTSNAPPVYDNFEIDPITHTKFGDLPDNLRIYYSYLYALDYSVNKLLTTLQQTGKTNTMVIFLGDNGAPGNYPLPSNGKLRAFKGTIYMGGTRTALNIWWPGHLPTNAVCSNLVGSIDVLPTALAAAGIAIPPELHVDGTNLLPLITGQTSDPPHNYLVWAGVNDGTWSYPKVNPPANGLPAAWSLKKDSWVLHYWAEDNSYVLYDTANDIGEKVDVSALHPDVVSDLRARYTSWYTNGVVSAIYTNELPFGAWLGVVPVSELTQSDYYTRITYARNTWGDELDLDTDEIPDWWEFQKFSSSTNSSGAATDFDKDGFNDLSEYLAGTDPTNSASLLGLQPWSQTTAGKSIITWQSISGKSYSVLMSTNLLGGWTKLVTITASGTVTSYTNNSPNPDCSFYKVNFNY